MRHALRGLATLTTALVLAACSPAATTAPATGPAATTGSAATAGPAATTGPAATEVAQVCAEPAAGEATDVEASVAGNAWGPVAAKVGDVITWTNGDSVPHKVALDDGSCTMAQNIAGGGGKQSLAFSVTGSFPFHCTIHSSMKGTIVIS